MTIGTLLHLAKEHGLHPAQTRPGTSRTKPRSPGATRTRAGRSPATRTSPHRGCPRPRSAEAAALWAQASDQGESGYLTRKGVQAYALRFTTDGRVLAPPARRTRRAAQPANDQRQRRETLFAWRPKVRPMALVRHPRGCARAGRVRGLRHAASVHQATGRPAAVAFDAGNLANVAKALRKLHPAALLVLCGDDDKGTEARTGSNPGPPEGRSGGACGAGVGRVPRAPS